MTDPPPFYTQLREAVLHPIVGWNFEWIRGRIVRGEFSWNYTERVRSHARRSPDLLDLGTGGGEWLAQLDPRPSRTVATESYAPNVPVARARLAPFSVDVVHTGAAPDNSTQEVGGVVPALPFRDQAFHLIADRNESFAASEVARILAPGGRFITQQVGTGWNDDWYRLFDRVRQSPVRPPWTAALATQQLERAGLRVVRREEGSYTTEFHDIGAVVWYLLAVPWTLPGFSVDRDVASLKRIDRTLRADGPLKMRFPGFLVEAERPQGRSRTTPGNRRRTARKRR